MAPYLVLPTPTPCDFGDPPGTDEDDSFCNVTLSSAVHIYSQSSTTVYASTNGYLSILYGQAQYQPQAFPDSHIPNNTVAPFLSDLYIFGTSSPHQGIWYETFPNGTMMWEYYTGRYQGPSSQVYHFTVATSTVSPGVWVYTYYATGGSTDDGVHAAVGAQGGKSSLRL